MSDASTRPLSALRDFLESEALGGVVLIAAAALALLVANLPATANAYARLMALPLGPVLAPDHGAMTLRLWVNDGAMALFFLTVGLEIKRELVDGNLARADQRRLPFIAAAAGMAVPALVFTAIVGAYGAGASIARGWAIPAATDIAFALGVLALLGRRVPSALKLMLATIAIVDDMGAVAIIALAYTARLHPAALAGAGLALLVLYVINRRGVARLWPYLLAGAALWLSVLRSGVHATVAGVLLALLVPIRRSPGAPDDETSPLHRLEHALHPWSAYLIVPLFAFVNAGIDLRGIDAAVLAHPLVLAVAAGLFLGKQAGIFGAIAGAARLGIARPSRRVTWRQVYGMALLAGIGFTMSLFIGGLAFGGDPALMAEVKIGVLLGSALSALAGYAVLAGAPAARSA